MRYIFPVKRDNILAWHVFEKVECKIPGIMVLYSPDENLRNIWSDLKMGIKKIKIKNFKSFKNLEIDLDNFNILIGANASGKSNFISIFNFIRDIVNHGLNDAISMQGGVDYFRNINIGNTENFSLEIISDYMDNGTFETKNGNGPVEVNVIEVSYRFSIEFHKAKFSIGEDRLFLKYDLIKSKAKIGEGSLALLNDKGKLKTEIKLPGNVKMEKKDVFPFVNLMDDLSPKGLLLETPFFQIPFGIAEIFKNISIYNFDPRQSKKAIPLTGKTELEEDGSNLAIALKNIIDNKNSRNRFTNLIKDVLSFVDNLDVQKFADRSLLLRLKEVYSKDKFLWAPFLSDGTLNITALILALYFGEKPLIIMEEPERNIHPHLISKIMEMMKEVSSRKQIVVTTHNPELLKHIDLEDILFISRDKEGFSKITRPAESEQVKIFLNNEMGIDELYTQNLLELQT